MPVIETPDRARASRTGIAETDARVEGAFRRIATLLAGAPTRDLRSAWCDASEQIGHLVGADRVCLVSARSDGPFSSLGGWERLADGPRPIPIEEIDESTRATWLERWSVGDAVIAMSAASGEPCGDSTWLDARLATALVAVPLRIDGIVIGALLVEQLRRGEADVATWKAAAERFCEPLAASVHRGVLSGTRDVAGGPVAGPPVLIGPSLLASLNHALRTPLNGVLGMSDLIDETTLTPDQRDAVTMIRASGRALLSVVDDALDLSHLSAGQLELDHLGFSLRDAVYRSIKSAGTRAADACIELECQISPEVPDAVSGDRGRVQQIMETLLGLALEIPGVESVTLRVNTETGDAGRAHLHFALVEGGCGLPTESIPRMFESEGVDAIVAEFNDGAAGLRLALAKMLIGRLGGRIWAESDPQSGSIIHFTVALDLTQGDAGPSAGTLPAELRDEPVLVAIDNPTIRDELVDMLVSWQLKPAMLPGPEAIVATLQRAEERGDRFGLAVVEIPEGIDDPEELGQQLAGEALSRELPLVLLARSGEPGSTGESLASEVVPRLSRPYSAGELFDAVVLAARRVPRSDGDTGDVAGDGNTGETTLRVLIAEDHPMNRKLAVKLVQRQGHDVVAVENGQQAVRALEEGDFDVVLMDLQMPVLGGIDATVAIRARERADGGHVPIVAVTAHSQREHRQLCLDAGMDAYVAKPLDAAELWATIRRLVRRYRSHRA